MYSVENTNVVFDMNEHMPIFLPVVIICQPEKETDENTEQEQS